MKINMPVTDHEVTMKPNATLVSKTNLKGILTYANRDFVEISGFSEGELIGKNHNLVRHPDMPPEAFQDLWNEMKAGRPWTGMVKNRTKNGDFYWVKANVVPVRKGGQVVEYMSVRTVPAREEIEAAENLYRGVREKKLRLSPSAPTTLTSIPLKTVFMVMGGGMTLLLWLLALWNVNTGGNGLVSTLLGLLGGMSVVGAVAVTRYILKPMAHVEGKLMEMSEGNYFDWATTGRGDEVGAVLNALKSAQMKLGFDIKDVQEAAARAERIRQALDNVSANVMVADASNQIVYLNGAVQEMFQEAEEDICGDLPNFRAGELLGASIDTFHKNPAHQQGLLAKLTGTHEAEFMVGGRHMKFIANPVVDDDGKRLGTVVEWADRTAEVRVEQEVEQLVNAAQAGDLDRRLGLDDKQGFYRALSEGMNRLLDVVSQGFGDVVRVMGALSQGNLTQKIEQDYQGTYGQVKGDVNATVERLQEIVAGIRESTDLIQTGAEEIVRGNNNLSERTEQQASSLEETASSMEELTSTVRNNADNAQQANQLASDARGLAEKGGEVVSDAVSAMQAISDSSNRIAEIIGVIDEIAFQTNLLALNASVEAARAGEQGRGFAVVATEVRNLAQRSATAAKEIKELIQDSVAKVNNGSGLVNDSGQTLGEIVVSVKKVGDIISEIAAASQEQAAGIDQVNRAVTEMDEMTQQNAALAEQTSAASASMAEQSGEMAGQIEFFQLQGQTVRPGGSAPASQDGHSTLDFAAARTKHLAWKTKLKAFLEGKQGIDESEAVSHHDCALGHWLYPTGMEKYGYLGEMQELEKIHADMHRHLKDVVVSQNRGDRGSADASYQQVVKLSNRIVVLLKQIEGKVSDDSRPASPTRRVKAAPVGVVASSADGDDDWEEF